MNIGRLSKLKLMLLNISDTPVRQGFYFKGDGKISTFANGLIDKMRPIHFSMNTWRSGTSACAFTFACYRYEFEGEGLSFDIETNLPKYEDVTGLDAIEKFFGINEEEARFLFIDRSYLEKEKTSPVDVYMRLCDLMLCKDETAREVLIYKTSDLMYYRQVRDIDKKRIADMAAFVKKLNAEEDSEVSA